MNDKTIDFEKNSDLLKALAHPVRLRMVCGLMSGDGCNVNKIVENLQLPQSTVSQHLSVLRGQGIINYRKEGVKTCYYVTDERVKKLIYVLKGE
ncbi:MAG: winged helix-turn-helix transcriptional regulator [Sedimentisphaerales bacterium]|nr:winged helix-turn-helix transcriptional regulator [Sedimentisphaerales bacterium]MBN2842227.1 winged helix-turn-helix transcriptional regulator [Sedimentisphaerales bacterium]